MIHCTAAEFSSQNFSILHSEDPPSAGKTREQGTGQSELRSCVKVEVAVLGSLSLMSLMVSVEVKLH